MALLLALLLSCAWAAPTPTSPPFPVWPSGSAIPGEHPGAFGNETSHCLTAGVPIDKCEDLMVTDVTVPTLTPFVVPNATSAMIVAPGGGYSGLAINREGTDIAAWLNGIGVSATCSSTACRRATGCPSAEHRSWTPSAPWASCDLSRTPRGLKVGFMGFSAGGHLTGHLNVAWQNRSYPRVDAADDAACRPDFSIMVYPWRSVSQPPVNEPLSGASAENVTKDTPPTMLVQAEDDPVHVENALFYWYARSSRRGGLELHLPARRARLRALHRQQGRGGDGLRRVHVVGSRRALLQKLASRRRRRRRPSGAARRRL